MSKKLRSGISLLLCALLLFSPVLSSCSTAGNEEDAPAPSSDPSPAADAEPAEEEPEDQFVPDDLGEADFGGAS